MSRLCDGPVKFLPDQTPQILTYSLPTSVRLSLLIFFLHKRRCHDEADKGINDGQPITSVLLNLQY